MNPERSHEPEVALILGERVVSHCDNGALVVENMLFESAEVLVASEGVAVREIGYLTTAALAREHLDAAGITPALAAECFAALRPGHLRALARSPIVLGIVERLTPYEAFEGGRFNAESERYEGVWIDLDALASACPLSGAAYIFQALHLRVAVEESRNDDAVRLTTARLTAASKANTRTWRRTPLDNAKRLPAVLSQMRVPARAQESIDETTIKEELLLNLRQRGAASEAPVPRLHSLALRISRPPSVPPSAPPELIVTDSADEIPVETTAFDELRRHSEMLHGEEDIRAVAKLLSEVKDGTLTPELSVLAARAWLAGGEKARARFFARRVVDDPAAPDEIRLMALEILESTAPTNESRVPPPFVEAEPAVQPVVALVGASLPPHTPAAPETATTPMIPRLARPPKAEIVESMALAPGLAESMLGEGAPVRTVEQAHIATTRLARELARDYRLAYGTTLKTDPMAIEAMQRHLRRRIKDTALGRELLRHGALLSEILARSMGAKWFEIGEEPGHWVMLVPSSTPVRPIGRVYRFFEQGPRESDLVAYYFELEKSARASR